jgi:transposase
MEQLSKKGEGFSAWLGIVPGEYTTGGKQKLLGISKRGTLTCEDLVQGARAVLQQSAKTIFRSECVAGPTHNPSPQ